MQPSAKKIVFDDEGEVAAVEDVQAMMVSDGRTPSAAMAAAVEKAAEKAAAAAKAEAAAKVSVGSSDRNVNGYRNGAVVSGTADHHHHHYERLVPGVVGTGAPPMPASKPVVKRKQVKTQPKIDPEERKKKRQKLRLARLLKVEVGVSVSAAAGVVDTVVAAGAGGVDDGAVSRDVDMADAAQPQQVEPTTTPKKKSKRAKTSNQDNASVNASTAETTAATKPNAPVTVAKASTSTNIDTNIDPSTDPARISALSYLDTFTNNRKSWKFQKVRQVWLLRNLYYPSMIPDARFKDAIKYMDKMGDRAKRETVLEAKGIIEQADHVRSVTAVGVSTCSGDGDGKDTGGVAATDTVASSPASSVSQHILRRARRIVNRFGSSE